MHRTLCAVPVLLLIAIGGGAAPADQAPDCALTLDVAQGSSGLNLTVSAPCNPYAVASISYGALEFPLELGLSGRANATLPAIPFASEIRATVAGATVNASLAPPSDTTQPVSAIDWPDDARWGRLAARDADPARDPTYVLGTTSRSDLNFLDVVVGPAQLTVAVDDENCGTEVDAMILLPGQPDWQELALTVPGCARIGQSIVLDLS